MRTKPILKVKRS